MLALKRAAPRTRNNRSGFTNNPYRLEGVDMRSERGRRYRDIVDGLVAEFGDTDAASIRELAGLKIVCEGTQAAVVAGDASAREDLVRISNLIARRETAMRESVRSRPDPTPSLSDYLAQKAALA